MSILKSLFSNQSLTDTILKNFVEEYKKQGIKQILVSLNDDDSLKVDTINEENIVVPKVIFDGYKSFFDTLTTKK